MSNKYIGIAPPKDRTDQIDTKAQQVDFSVQNEGSIFILYGKSPECKAWIEEHVGNDETQRWCGGIVVEHRYIQDIVNGLEAEGFVGEQA